MADQKNVAFRTSLNGYNREDVNRYILEMNRAFAERENALISELTDAKKRTDEAELQLSALREQTEAAQKGQNAAEKISASLRETVEQLKEENAAFREQAASAQASTAVCTDMEKSQKYDQISSQIGDILINANSSADRIVASANAEATRILTETEDEATYIRARLSTATDEMLTSISGLLHESTDNCISELMVTLREMRDGMSSFLEECKIKNQEMSEKITYYQTNVYDTVSDALAAMDEKYGIRSAKKPDGSDNK